MGKPICAVPLPPELQRELPAGALVYSFDGEVVFRSKNPNLNQEPRTYSLMPVSDNELMYERRWNGQPIQDTYLSIEHFHGHVVTMFFLYFPIPKSTTSQLSEKFLPMVKEAAKNLPVTQELYSAAEKLIPAKEPDTGPLYRTAAFAAMSWSTHQWLWITSTLAAGFVIEGPMTLTAVVAKSMFTRNFIGKRLDQNDRNAVIFDRLVTYLRSEMNNKMQQSDTTGGRL
jgi:hypothetical protein